MGRVFMLMVPQGKGPPLKAMRVHAEKSNLIGLMLLKSLKNPSRMQMSFIHAQA